MLAGKWISKMFEGDEKRNIIIEKERFSYEFTCNKHYKEMENIIGHYFGSNFEKVKYTECDLGKV